jgi:hypothetical protein
VDKVLAPVHARLKVDVEKAQYTKKGNALEKSEPRFGDKILCIQGQNKAVIVRQLFADAI